MKLSVQVKNEFDKKQRIRYENFLLRRQKILQKLPQITELQKKRNACWIEAIKGNISIDSCEEKAQEYENKIQLLLKENGFETRDINYQPLCKKCNDSGFHDNHMCTCLKKEVLKSLYMQSNLSEILEKECFDTFDETLFSNKKGTHKHSPRENILLAKDKSIRFIENFDTSVSNLLFIGTAGTGKTFLSNCIAKALLDKGKTVVYLSAFNLVERLTDLSFGKIDKKEAELLFSSDLLIIDDLGCERNTEYAEQQLLNLLNERLNRKKSMLISTNLSIGEISAHYTERFSSRLVGCFDGIRFYGDDIRIALHLKSKTANH